MGDREGEASRRAQEGRPSSCSIRSRASRAAYNTIVPPSGKSALGAASTATRCSGRSASSARRGTSRKAGSLTIISTRAGRHRLADGRGHLRGVQGHRQPRDIHLDRKLTDRRVFSRRSTFRRAATRKEELLIPEGNDLNRVWVLRQGADAAVAGRGDGAAAVADGQDQDEPGFPGVDVRTAARVSHTDQPCRPIRNLIAANPEPRNPDSL